MAESDQHLVHRTLSGDTQAFGDLVERYERLVHGLILETVRRPDETEDLVQEVFSKAYEQLSSLREPASFAGWVARLASNTAIQWLRHRQVRVRSVTERERLLPLTSQQPDEVCEERETARYLWKAVDNLAPEQRRAVVLYYLEGCTHREIGRFLGVSTTAVRYRLLCARRRLIRELGEIVGQEALQRPKVRRSAREKILAALPVVAFFRPEKRPWWGWLWDRRGWLGLGCAGLLGLGSVAYWERGMEERMASETAAGFRVRREKVELPEMSAFWEPRRPTAGEQVRIEVAGEGLAAKGEQAFLHYITNPDYPVDETVPMQREGDGWKTELTIPERAKAVFFYVSGEEDSPINRHASWTPGHRRGLRQYRWSLLVHDDEGWPLRDAEFTVAEKELLSGRPFPEVRVHLDREMARYPDNVKAYNEGWFHALREDSTAGEWVREEQRRLMARFPDEPEVFFALARYAGPDLPETYRELRARFSDYARTDELAYLWSGFYRMEGDTTNQVAMLEEVIHSFPGSRYVDDAYADLIDVLAPTDPVRAAQLADSLIDGQVPGGRSGLRSTKAETAEGRAYGVRFELLLREGDMEGAFGLAERLMRSDLDDLSPFLQIGSRLSGEKCWWFPGNVACPWDLPLATRVLEAGRPWAELEGLRARLTARWSASRGPVSYQERVGEEQARRLRGTYLKNLGRCYLAQERFGEAVTCLREVVELLADMEPHWSQDEACTLLGEALEGMGDRDGAWDAYEQALAFTGEFPPAEEALGRLYAGRYGDREGFQAFLRERRPPAPEFALVDVRGQVARLSDWVGRPVLLFYKRFFGKPFDERTVEALEEWQRRYGRELVVFYVGNGLIDQERFSALAREQTSGLRVALDDGSVYEGYKPEYAEMFLIDRLGRLRWRGSWREEESEEIGHRIGEVVAVDADEMNLVNLTNGTGR